MSNVALGRLNPLFIDLETRSRVDLKVGGGWTYANDPHTHLLTVAWSSDIDVFNVWFPGHEESWIPESHRRACLADVQYVHYGPDVPQDLLDNRHRPWYAHNAWTFDQPVWEAKIGDRCRPASWGDTYPLALAAGLPGGLGAIGTRLWGDGKYAEGAANLKQFSRATGSDDALPGNVPPGVLPSIAKYNVQDVRLLRWLWDELVATLEIPEDEYAVLLAHRDIITRGARVDLRLLAALRDLAAECKRTAVDRIAKLTDGFLSTPTDLNSRKKVFDWISRMGIPFGSSLRKEIVLQFIDRPVAVAEDAEDEDDPNSLDDGGPPTSTRNLAVVMKVLELRMQALRITEGKLTAATQSVNADERMRGFLVYWGAGPGRWAGRRIQPHNFPRPKDGVDTWAAIDLFDAGKLTFAEVDKQLPDRSEPKYRFLSVDDVSSALIRMIFVPEPDCSRRSGRTKTPTC